jgi:hypothetical protein
MVPRDRRGVVVSRAELPKFGDKGKLTWLDLPGDEEQEQLPQKKTKEQPK